MLVSEFVEVKVVGGTLEFYKKFYPNIKCLDIIKIHISELPKTSKQNIQVRCDCCSTIFDFHFDAYSRYRKDIINEKYECRDCEINRIWNNVINTCKDLNYTLLSDKSVYKIHKTKIDFICNKHIEHGIQKVTINTLLVKKCGCKLCTNKKKSDTRLSEFGGITPLHNYLRSKIAVWTKDSIKYNNYKCVLTNKRFDTVHHLYGFNMILSETLKINKLPIYESVNKYSKVELSLMEKTCLELHYKYGFGICLVKELHEIFHKIYSCGDNTPEQFEEFKQRYNNFEFDDLLEDKYKYCNIKLKEVS